MLFYSSCSEKAETWFVWSLWAFNLGDIEPRSTEVVLFKSAKWGKAKPARLYPLSRARIGADKKKGCLLSKD